jgi:hypothetical protein
MRFRMFATSLPGPKYASKGWACQDSSGTTEFDHIKVIAIADGHGNQDCFRSEIGSSIAIETAFNQTKHYFSDANDESDLPVRFSETGIINFKYSIWLEWKRKIKEHWDSRLQNKETFGDEEVRFKSVSEKYKGRFTSEDEFVVSRYLYTAYGTTLLFVVAIASQILILQIGDGTCVILQRNGEYRMPVPSEEQNFLNVTVSLCEEDAHLKIRHAVIDCDSDSPTAPVAVFLSSDGVDDCYPVFRNEEHLYKLYSIIIENISQSGFEETETEIANNLLPGMTTKSSQDDISLAYLITEDAVLLREAFENIMPLYKATVNADVKQIIDTNQKAVDDEEFLEKPKE